MSKFQQGHRRSAKLSPDQVLEMRRLYADAGWSQSRLARHFQVSVGQVGRIVRGEQWQSYGQLETEQELEDRAILSPLPPASEIEASLSKIKLDPFLEGIMNRPAPTEDPIESILRRRAAQPQENPNAPQPESPVSQANGESSEAPASEPPTAPRPPKAG